MCVERTAGRLLWVVAARAVLFSLMCGGNTAVVSTQMLCLLRKLIYSPLLWHLRFFLLDISVGLCWTCDSVSCSFSYHIALHFYLDFCKLQDFTLFLNRSCPTVRMLPIFFIHSPADRHFSCLLSFTNVTFAPVIMEGKHLNRPCKCPEVELLGHKVVRYSYQTWSLHLM